MEKNIFFKLSQVYTYWQQTPPKSLSPKFTFSPLSRQSHKATEPTMPKRPAASEVTNRPGVEYQWLLQPYPYFCIDHKKIQMHHNFILLLHNISSVQTLASNIYLSQQLIFERRWLRIYSGVWRDHNRVVVLFNTVGLLSL